MENKNKPIIVILETARINKNMSKGEFAEYLGIHMSTLSKILQEKIEVGDEVGRKIKSKGINIDNPIIKEKEIESGGMTLVEQIEMLKEQCSIYKKELRSLISQLKQLEKDCGDKEDCLVKNIKLKNEVGV